MKRFKWLKNIINLNGFKDIVEVGTGGGHTSKYLLKKIPDIHLVEVAYYPEDGSGKDTKAFETAWRNRIAPFLDRVTVLEGPSIDVCGFVPDGFYDLVFIDANHSYENVLEDIKVWLPKIKKGGIICGHDCNHIRFPGVKKAVEEVFGDKAIQEPFNDWIWYVRISNETNK